MIRTSSSSDASSTLASDAAHYDELKQEIAEAYYDDDITLAVLKVLVGHEEAANFRILKEQLADEFIDDALVA
ncbi:hypothetical protein [Haladaptatus sp. NG-SE-30]